MPGLPELPDWLHYVESDLPPGMTIAEFQARRAKRSPRPDGPQLVRRLLAMVCRPDREAGGALGPAPAEAREREEPA